MFIYTNLRISMECTDMYLTIKDCMQLPQVGNTVICILKSAKRDSKNLQCMTSSCGFYLAKFQPSSEKAASALT